MLRKVFTDESIDFVNPHHFLPFSYSFLATRGLKTKLIFTEHSRWQLEQLNPLKKIINTFFLNKTDAVIAISQQIKDYYQSK